MDQTKNLFTNSRKHAPKALLLGLLIVTICCSCSTVRLKDRAGMDQQLGESNAQQLAGTYASSVPDTARDFYNRELLDHFKPDTVSCMNCSVRLVPIDPKRWRMEEYTNDSLVRSITVKGKWKRGYFKARRKCRTNFVFGPLLWVLAEDVEYIGLTNDNNLVVLNSGGNGLLLLVVVPIFAGGGGDFWNEYERLK